MGKKKLIVESEDEKRDENYKKSKRRVGAEKSPEKIGGLVLVELRMGRGVGECWKKDWERRWSCLKGE